VPWALVLEATSWTISLLGEYRVVSTMSGVSRRSTQSGSRIHLSKAGLMFNAQINKLDKNEKSGKLWGPIAGLQYSFPLSYSTASTSFCGGDVIPEPKKDQKGKIRTQK
jgi:hypothetical protein